MEPRKVDNHHPDYPLHYRIIGRKDSLMALGLERIPPWNTTMSKVVFS
jgi:hypothetical protein